MRKRETERPGEIFIVIIRMWLGRERKNHQTIMFFLDKKIIKMNVSLWPPIEEI